MNNSGRVRVLDPLRYSAFRRAWLAAVLDGFGTGLERLAVGWFVLDANGSVFLATLSFAARAAPNMFFGTVGGAIADRFQRPRVLMTTVAARALLILAVGSIVLAGVHSTCPLVALIALTGVTRASETPST
jgi:MFS family permease